MVKKDDRLNLLILGLFFFVLIFPSVIVFSTSHQLNIALGVSMEPTFGSCTLLLVNNEVEPSSIVSGDIVVIDVPNGGFGQDKVSHRVVENNLEVETISTRGDNDSLYDFPSSVDGFYDYSLFVGRVESYFELPEVLCE